MLLNKLSLTDNIFQKCGLERQKTKNILVLEEAENPCGFLLFFMSGETESRRGQDLTQVTLRTKQSQG
jgi:hypothetical protein